MQKSKAIVIDIDGVILDSNLILKEIYDLKLKGDTMWSYFTLIVMGIVFLF